MIPLGIMFDNVSVDIFRNICFARTRCTLVDSSLTVTVSTNQGDEAPVICRNQGEFDEAVARPILGAIGFIVCGQSPEGVDWTVDLDLGKDQIGMLSLTPYVVDLLSESAIKSIADMADEDASLGGQLSAGVNVRVGIELSEPTEPNTKMWEASCHSLHEVVVALKELRSKEEAERKAAEGCKQN